MSTTVPGRCRIVFNALPLSPRGGGVSTYIRELLGSLTVRLDADLVAAVHPSGLSELPGGVTPMVKGESRGLKRAVVSAAGFGP
ncbi:MAG: glycosyltransferase family 1 protein, partial [Acidimicrobiales bacterium]